LRWQTRSGWERKDGFFSAHRQRPRRGFWPVTRVEPLTATTNAGPLRGPKKRRQMAHGADKTEPAAPVMWPDVCLQDAYQKAPGIDRKRTAGFSPEESSFNRASQAENTGGGLMKSRNDNRRCSISENDNREVLEAVRRVADEVWENGACLDHEVFLVRLRFRFLTESRTG